jgi:hypothetical protein
MPVLQRINLRNKTKQSINEDARPDSHQIMPSSLWKVKINLSGIGGGPLNKRLSENKRVMQ